ncbi:hypothetical protein [Lactiplantibacillus mudanjiangensis]|uniref:Uncharacterized protein n=1 Tax=Lactiplantibacillus mudanjiangensis TaxID=1296538 RepID=A0A660DZ21_9LACO|nr:hypothetical protein [Lactiplantibacillus mudanjiangensis]VDG25470.1 hypothetical protein MUDAN_IGPPGNFN_03270 [Lactiplantibacillus mudanjiangensis]VDG28566.1 hypothetical protein MUDAN_MDHGFNIF_02993 [Lactiplantibacillus mudanjiangensis]
MRSFLGLIVIGLLVGLADPKYLAHSSTEVRRLATLVTLRVRAQSDNRVKRQYSVYTYTKRHIWNDAYDRLSFTQENLSKSMMTV